MLTYYLWASFNSRWVTIRRQHIILSSVHQWLDVPLILSVPPTPPLPPTQLHFFMLAKNCVSLVSNLWRKTTTLIPPQPFLFFFLIFMLLYPHPFLLASIQHSKPKAAPPAPRTCKAAGFSSCCSQRGRGCYLSAGQCWCDRACHSYGNCCPDINSICKRNGKSHPQVSITQHNLF